MLASTSIVAACSADFGAMSNRDKADDRTQVALLLPLSGDRAALGQQMAKAVWLVEDFGGVPGRTQVLDAGETPQAAADATRQAVTQGASIIVGPLFRNQTPAVVQASGNVPVLSLSNDSMLISSGAWVFGVTPAQSVDAVLGFAQSSGARRMAVLETSGPIGQQAVQTVGMRARKARVVALPAIPARTEPAQMANALRQSGDGQMPDIVYVPSADVSALRQAEAAVAAGVTTIGSLQWSGLAQPDLNRLDKACFTGPDPVRFNRLSSFFQTQLDEDLGVIGALAVDAVGMAHAAGREGMLNKRTAYDGLLGETRFEEDRSCQRALAILRIDGGRVLPVT